MRKERGERGDDENYMGRRSGVIDPGDPDFHASPL